MNGDQILDALDVAVYAKDREGRYTYVNRYVRDLFRLPAAEILGKDDSHFFDLEQSNALKVNDAEVMSSGQTVRREERDVIANALRFGAIGFTERLERRLRPAETAASLLAAG